MKHCIKCFVTKPLAEFAKNNTKSGFGNICLVCKRADIKQRRLKDPEKHAERCKLWRELNKDKVMQYNQETKDIQREKDARYRARHRDKERARVRKYRELNLETVKEKEKRRRYLDRQTLKEVYLVNTLTKQGWKLEQLTPELIDTKRILIKTERLLKQKQI